MSSGSFEDRREQFKARTKAFAIAAIEFCAGLPQTQIGKNVDNQLTRSATSVASNYRASCRARSAAECLAKLGIVEEEADEALFWLEICSDLKLSNAAARSRLLNEANQLVAIVVTSRKKMKQRISESKPSIKVVRESGNGEDLFGDMPFEEI